MPKLIAWDFDGVLNRNFDRGFFLWQRTFESDLGVSATQFTDFMFKTGRFENVLIGKRDVLDLLGQWIRESRLSVTPRHVLDYWLAKDARIDAQVLGWLRACKQRSVIATNNESHRADYMMNQMGFVTDVERIFASGVLGVRKPDPRFFAHIEDWSGQSAADILLIDDSAANIAAAASRGWQVFLFSDATRDKLPEVLGVTP